MVPKAVPAGYFQARHRRCAEQEQQSRFPPPCLEAYSCSRSLSAQTESRASEGATPQPTPAACTAAPHLEVAALLPQLLPLGAAACAAAHDVRDLQLAQQLPHHLHKGACLVAPAGGEGRGAQLATLRVSPLRTPARECHSAHAAPSCA